MRKLTWLVVAALALILATAGAGLLGFVVALLILGVPYAVVCRFSPRSRHVGFRSCGGTGEARSRLYPWAYHRCAGCNGTGRHIRAGARVFGPEYAKNEARRAKETRRTRSENKVWR